MLPIKHHMSAVGRCNSQPRPCSRSMLHVHCMHSARRGAAASAQLRVFSPQRLPRQQHARHTTAVAPIAYLPNADRVSDAGGGGGAANTSKQLQVLVVGANPAGLAAAVALAQQAGCVVQVHDSRADPRGDKHAANSSTLMGLGKRGLQALIALNLPPPSTSGRSKITTINTRGSGTTTSTSNSTSSSSGAGSSGAHSSGASSSGVNSSGTSSGWADLGPEPLPGLTLLQGLQALGPRGHTREAYGAAASRSKPQGSAVTGNRTAGVAAIDELSLTTRLLAASAALAGSSDTTDAHPHPTPQLVLPSGASAASSTSSPQEAAAAARAPAPAPATGLLGPKGTTPLPRGLTSAPSAEAAQEAAMPAVVASAATAGGAAAAAAPSPLSRAVGRVEVQYSSHLTLLDAANKQATFMGPGGQASVVTYDLIVAADTSGGGHLVTSALQQLQARQVAHKHPAAHNNRAAAAAAATAATAAASGALSGASAGAGAPPTPLQQQQQRPPSKVATVSGRAGGYDSSGSVGGGGVEQEFRAWHDMPNDPTLTALLGKGGGLKANSSPGPSSSTPQQGWLLVWTSGGGPGSPQAARPNLPSAAAAAGPNGGGGGGAAAPLLAHIPGAPSCTLMAWPSKGGASWSGCVFTDPQVFEALRSQQDYEQLLSSLPAPAGGPALGGGVGGVGLPSLWVPGIAAQLKCNDRVGRVLSPAPAPPPSQLAAPAAGVVALSTAAVPADSPQLLQPGACWGLGEAAALAAHLAEHLAATAAEDAHPAACASAFVGTATGGPVGAGDKAAVVASASSAESSMGQAVSQALEAFAGQHSHEALVLHKLTAQLSWLRQPFSPAAATAAASVPWGSLAWLGASLGAPHTGLVLQWRCLLAVLPVTAGVQRLLRYKLGLGRADSVPHRSRARSASLAAAAAAAAGGGGGGGGGATGGPASATTATATAPPRLDASYRRPPASGQASTSVDSGVHVDSKNPGSSPNSSASSSSSNKGGFSAASGAPPPHAAVMPEAYSLSDVAAGIEPCGSSFLAFLHTSGLAPSQLWRLLQAAPLLLSLLWGGLLWATLQAVRWAMWAYRAWGWAQGGVG